MMLSFTIPGKPVSKARARTVSKGGRVWSFTPSKTVKHENLIKLAALHARQEAKLSVLAGSFSLEVICYGAHPRSDWDNLGKAVSDALNGVIWHDDSQVDHAMVRKLPCLKGQERTEVTVFQVCAY